MANINANTFFKLLEKKKDLEKKGESFEEDDKMGYWALMEYFSRLNDKIFWESRTNYLQMLELLDNKQITLKEFWHKFNVLTTLNSNEYNTLQAELEDEPGKILSKFNEMNFQSDSEWYNFSDIIDDLFFIVDMYDPAVTFEEDLKYPDLFISGMSEEFLRLKIKDIYLPKVKKYCQKS